MSIQGNGLQGTGLNALANQNNNNQLALSGNQGGSLQGGVQLGNLHGTSLDALANLSSQQQQPSQAVAPSQHGREFMENAMSDGALSTRQDKEMLAEIQRVVRSTAIQIVQTRQMIDRSIQEFFDLSNEFNGKMAAVSTELAKKLVSGEILDPNDANRFTQIKDIATSIGNRYYETSKQYMDLQKLNSDGKLADYKGVIDLIFFARMQELKLLSERMDVIRAQENHEMEVMIAIQNQELKVEAQAFDQAMQKFDAVSKYEIEQREQRRREEQDIMDNALKRAKIDSEEKLATIKAENDRSIEDARIQAEKDIQNKQIASNEAIEKSRIRAQERMNVVNAAASVASARPKCIIQ